MAQLKRKRITKKEIEESRRLAGLPLKSMACKQCNRIEKKVSPDAVSVICSVCVTKMIPLPESQNKPKPPEERRPRGWQFMKEYRAPDGTLYRRGEKVDEPDPIPSTKTGRKGSSIRKTAPKATNKDVCSKDRKGSKSTTGRRRTGSGKSKPNSTKSRSRGTANR